MKQTATSPHPVTQRTLRESITYVGVGLHSGHKVSLSIKPAPVNNGVVFIRKDMEPGKNMIPARWYTVTDTSLSTTLGNEYGINISTVEHLLAALHGCGVDNAIIEVDGPEIPIMDGSSAPFVNMIEKVGTHDQDATRHAIWIQSPIEVQHGDRYALLLPSKSPRITVSIDFPNTAIGFQTYSVELVNEAFRHDVARARTFGFSEQIEQLKTLGLARGGSLRNAVLVDGDRIVNEEGLRYSNEFVRHKILDCLGDLSLAGVPIYGHYYANKPGHELNTALLSKLFETRSAWSYIPVEEYNRLMGIEDPNITSQEIKMEQEASDSVRARG